MAGPRGRGARWGKTQARVEPEGQVRQSQAVTTYGPGATMDLVKQAVLVGGLDFWMFGNGIQVIHEPRLREALASRFEAAGRPLSVEAAFREPPAGDDRDPTRAVGVAVLELPTWFVCQESRCRALTRRLGLDLRDGRWWHQCSERNRALGGPTECVPVRFVGACRRGHIEDWPWITFVHAGARTRCPSAQLVLDEGATGDFSEVIARCETCSSSAPLSAAYARTERCGGERPWLGSEGNEECAEALRLLVRTASNSYFAQVVSALSIPDPARELDERVASVWDVLLGATAESLPVFRTIAKVQAALSGFGDVDVLSAIARRKGGGKPARGTGLRTPEHEQLARSPVETPGELPPEDAPYFARRVTPSEPLPKGVSRIIVAPKLREVRAQIGFTRIDCVSPDLQGEFDLEVESARLGLTTDWLPATEIRGEGVLVQLDEDAVRAWEARAAVVARGRELLAGYESHAATLAHAPPFPGVRFYMLHSLAHLLLSAIALECGYAASAIRERIYCAPSTDSAPMASILLSTGTSGSEGTLGGLVEQGRVIAEHLRRAYDLGVLCSNDPVCAGHSPRQDPGERWLEGAACHGCLFVAECSCERFNRYLDRALVVPAIGHPSELAFLSDRP